MVTLSRRFSVAFILIVALPSLIVAVVLARLYLSALYSTVAHQSEATAEQMVQNIRGETDGVSFLAAALVHDRDLRNLADAYARASGQAERYRAARRLDEKLVSFFIYSNRIGAVVLYLKGGGVYYYSNYPNIRAIDRIDRAVFAGAANERGKVFLLDTLDGAVGNVGKKNMISIAVCPPPEEETALEVVLVMFRVPYFDGLAAGPGGEGGPDVVMLGRSGKPLLSSLPAAASGEDLGALALAGGAPQPSIREIRAGGRTWLAALRPMESTGWTIALLSDKAAISRHVTKYQWYLYPALGLLALLFIAYAEFFFARIAAPIRAMIGHMGRVGRGDYDVRAAPQNIAELADLSHGFNQMVEASEQMHAERSRIERERLASELDALRFQISPHFVANTLNSIRLMANAAHAGGIAAMTRDLMRILSDSYAGAGKLAELSREIESVSAYVGIMKVRFGELFGVELDVSPDAESLLALRVILQPIVENSILHGFSGGASGGTSRSGRGTIRVSARVEERALPTPTCPETWAEAVPGKILIIEVRDDGVGIDPARAAEILESKPEPGGVWRIGIANVQRRIRLHFGEPYGLAIEGEAGRYTLVRYLLPALRRKAEETGGPRV